MPPADVVEMIALLGAALAPAALRLGATGFCPIGASTACYLGLIMSRLISVSVAPIACTVLALPAGATAEIQLLRVGGWHGDQVGSTTPDGWHCLIRTAVAFELRPCTIEVTTFFDTVVGSNTGKKVSVPGLEDVVFLLRGLEGIAPGPVLAVFAGHYPFARGATLPLGDEMQRSFLTAEPAGRGFDVVLSEAGVRQVVARGLGLDSGDASPALLWAGDLDRDGRLDFLLDATDHNNVTNWVLFLSGGAAEGELVRRAAVFRTTGC
jgi:hypothetical protein